MGRFSGVRFTLCSLTLGSKIWFFLKKNECAKDEGVYTRAREPSSEPEEKSMAETAANLLQVGSRGASCVFPINECVKMQLHCACWEMWFTLKEGLATKGQKAMTCSLGVGLSR